MHDTSYLKMRAFRDTYLESSNDAVRRVLDLGSATYVAQESYKSLFEPPWFDYFGLDMTPGPNVDMVLADPYRWNEVETASADVVVSGQMLEHDAYFWVTMAEIGRVLRPGGWCCVIAPSRGPAHYFPRDCWRFYPDAGAAMLTFAGLDPVEVYVEPGSLRSQSGNEWGDMVAIGQLPEMDGQAHERHLQRLAHVVASVPDRLLPDRDTLRGPAVARYERWTRSPVWGWRPYLLRKGMAHLKMRVWNAAPPELQDRLSRLR
jgi:SAM-dependent methyltransferase